MGASGSTYAAGTDEPDLYFYHTDHLGSTTYITDRKEVAQYVAYTPYGETFKEYKNVTPYKFNGKELDQETGYYYYGARYYDPTTALWFGTDPLAHKYPMNSPYVYCNGNPVKYVDPDGRDWITASYGDDTFVFYDERVHSDADIKSVYYHKDGAAGRNSYDIKYVGKSGSFTRECDGGKTFTFNSDGTYSIDGFVQNGEYDNGGLHVGSMLYTDKKDPYLACQNAFYGNYAGGSNPLMKMDKKKYSYAMPPIDDLDYAAFIHDKGYDKYGAEGGLSAFTDIRVINVDYRLGYDCIRANSNGSRYKSTLRKALIAFSFVITGIKEMLR
jgi:RHS repeat-associated protein